MNRIIAIIPARYASTRFPGKPLVQLGERTMIHHVWHRANSSPEISMAVVATDDERIASECRLHAIPYVLTGSHHHSGTDRILEALSHLSGEEPELVINVQGDEPFLEPKLLSEVIALMRSTPQADVGTAVRPLAADEAANPNIVKVALSHSGRALYFSRATIPYYHTAPPHKSNREAMGFLAHIGLYAYRPKALLAFGQLPPSPLEIAESLEQLRLMEEGYAYFCVKTTYFGIGIDTPEDVPKALSLLEQMG